jgi:hypothetical protein
MAGDTFDIDGVDVSTFFSELTQQGIPAAEAKVFLGELLVRDRLPHRFRYATAFPAEDASCTPSFDRTFRHVDWVDGESVVQAEKTSGEEGFNLRFHRIEVDLDSVGVDLALAFTCLAGMRRSLRSLLDEIRVEIDRINALLADREQSVFTPLLPKTGIEFLGKTKVGDVDKYILREGEQFRLVDFGPLVNPVSPPVKWFETLPHDRFVGVFSDAIEKVRTTPELNEAVRGGATVEELRTRFGGTAVTETPEGTPILVGDLLRDVPGTLTFADATDPAAALVASTFIAVSVSTASELRGAVLSEPARDLPAAEVLKSDVTVLESVDANLAQDLKTAGVTNVESLARASAPELVTALNAAGVAVVDAASVERAVTAAKVARSAVRIG